MKTLKIILPLINLLPDSFIHLLGRALTNYLLGKYAEVEIQGKEILSERENTPTIFISNHLSNIDGVILNNLLKNNSAAFMAGTKLGKNAFTSFFLKSIDHIPITPGSPDKNAIKSRRVHAAGQAPLFLSKKVSSSLSSWLMCLWCP